MVGRASLPHPHCRLPFLLPSLHHFRGGIPYTYHSIGISLNHSSSPPFSSLYIHVSFMTQQVMSIYIHETDSSSKTKLGLLLRLFLGLLVVASILGQVAADDEKDVFEYEAEPRTRKRLTASKVQWMTPGCKHDLEIRQTNNNLNIYIFKE